MSTTSAFVTIDKRPTTLNSQSRIPVAVTALVLPSKPELVNSTNPLRVFKLNISSAVAGSTAPTDLVSPRQMHLLRKTITQWRLFVNNAVAKRYHARRILSHAISKWRIKNMTYWRRSIKAQVCFKMSLFVAFLKLWRWKLRRRKVVLMENVRAIQF
ncbi:hypothetical protein HK100_004521, partial [Physocladia obscura]